MRDDDGTEVAVRVVFHEALLLPSPRERLPGKGPVDC
jgi:hypothetical protein